MMEEVATYHSVNIGNSITVRKIPLSEIQKFCEIAFVGDNAFVEKYHFQDKTIEDLVMNNVINIYELTKQMPVKCYSIYWESKPIGFTVVAKGLLYSFGIKKEYRTKQITLTWLDWVKGLLAYDFVVCLFPENTRAINFFTRNGLTIGKTTKENVTLMCK
jgi:hypothetical protein